MAIFAAPIAFWMNFSFRDSGTERNARGSASALLYVKIKWGASHFGTGEAFG